MKKLTSIFVWLTFSFSVVSQSYIADYSIAKEEVLRSIPIEYINLARTTFKIAYQHTSHGTHVTYGMFGLPDYKSGDESLFAISRNEVVAGKLTLYDYAMESYAENGEDATDLSGAVESAFIQATRNYLDDPQNADVNVIMWSWCSITGHDVAGVYLPGMQTLIDEYGVGGTKIGTAAGQRVNPVHFIFMTGHASLDDNLGDLGPASQAKLINDYCRQKGYMCLDYYSIDAHCMDNNYWDDAGDDGNSYKYNNSTVTEGYFYHDWQNTHVLGTDYYENKTRPAGNVGFGDHTTQHITSNRKAFAMWWILARLAGWDGAATAIDTRPQEGMLVFSSSEQVFVADDALVGTSTLAIYNLAGSLVYKQPIASKHIGINGVRQGVYIALVNGSFGTYTQKIIVNR